MITTHESGTVVGPEMHGARMSLRQFASAVGQPGYTYELEKGIIVVDVPGISHAIVIHNIRQALSLYCAHRADQFILITGGGESAVRLPEADSERHPDVSVYLSPPPTDDEQAWDVWTPDIVVEVVSASSAKRDYEAKREEYLSTGVRTYWIIDPRTRTALVLVRRGDVWEERPLEEDGIVTSVFLPGFKLALGEVFRARR